MNGTIYLRDNAWFQRENVIKMGIASFAKDRSSTYITGEVERGEYICVIEIPLDKMRLLDSCLKKYFKPYHIYKGGGTEFYNRSMIDLLVPYLKKMNMECKVLTSEEILSMNRCERIKTIKHLFTQNIQKFTKKKIQWKEEFFSTFLPNKTPRRIQVELWDIWENIGDTCKGIIQWPTGTGKTIAMMILFFLTFKKCKKNGKLFRCLMIAPTNDIFDTLMHTILKLEKFGIKICRGHHAGLSSLSIPLDQHVLITATHASLTGDHWDKLPDMTMVHYDEVHRITGNEFYDHLVLHVEKWNPYLTGTSATPKTCDEEQHKKLCGLFGNPLQIIHRCDVDEAIEEGWIAKPRFAVHVISKQNKLNEFITIVKSNIEKKRTICWKGGKCIAYLPTRAEVIEAEKIARRIIPEAVIYSTENKTDSMFVSDVADGTIRILFACERYREGSDIDGLEMTMILMGDKIGAHIILQIAGRGLRNDYEGKEGWCVIVRPSEEGTTEDEVFDSILFQIMVFMNDTPTKEKVRHVVTKFFGEVSICGKIYNVEDTIDRIQWMYLREKPKKEKYSMIRLWNQERNVQTKEEYEETPKIENPKEYFKESWISWYHFLGVDTSLFPPTKQEWISMCKEKGIKSWKEYKEKKIVPLNPCEMYDDFTNWDKEMGIEEEIIW